MVHSSSVIRSVTSLSLAVCVAVSTGCVGVGKRSWLSMPFDAPAAGKIDVMWHRQVQRMQDPTRGGAIAEGLVGRMYLFESEALGAPIAAEGKVTIEVYDHQTQGDPKLIETTHFPAEVLSSLQHTDRIGIGYTLTIPCPPDVKQVHVTVKFEPKAAGKSLITTSTPIMLERAVSK